MTCLESPLRWSTTMLVLAVFAGCGARPEEATPNVDDSEPAITKLTVAELVAANDPVAAYDGERVELTGRVFRPGHVDPVSEALIVVLNEHGSELEAFLELAVHARFALPAEPRLRTLAPSQVVILRGELRNVSGKVWELHQSEFITAEPPSPWDVTAMELTKVFVGEAAEEPPRLNDTLRVTGTVVSAVTIVDRYLAVPLAGVHRDGEPTVVYVLIEPDHFGAVGEPLPDANDLVDRQLFTVGSEERFHGILVVDELTELVPGGAPAVAVLGYPTEWPEFTAPSSESRDSTD